MTQDDHVSFKAPTQPNTIIYLSLDGGKTQFGGTTNATYNKKSNTITLPAKGAASGGQTTQIQYPTSSDCGECSQLVEVNQNLAALNKTVEKIECWAWLIVLMLVIVTVIKMFEGRDK